jgi:hypothetical protein
MNPHPTVGVYHEDGHWITSVSFKHVWQAKVFHWLVNASCFHNATREY